MANFRKALAAYTAAPDQYDFFDTHPLSDEEADAVCDNAELTNNAFDALVDTRARTIPEVIAKCDAILRMVGAARELHEPAHVIAALRRDLAKLGN